MVITQLFILLGLVNMVLGFGSGYLPRTLGYGIGTCHVTGVLQGLIVWVIAALLPQLKLSLMNQITLLIFLSIATIGNIIGDIIAAIYRNPDYEYDVDTENLFTKQTHKYSKLIYILLALSTLIFVVLWIILGGIVSNFLSFDIQIPIFIGSIIVGIVVVITNFAIPRRLCMRARKKQI